MNKTLVLLLVTLSTAAWAQTKDSMKSLTTQEQTPACKLTSAELQQRKKTVVADLKAKLLTKTETDKGYSFKFNGSDEMLDLLNDFIKTERLCCDFFTFQITIDGEFAWLELSGPAGTKDFIKDELEL